MKKTGYIGLLALLIASFILPLRFGSLAPVNAEITSKMEWVMVDTPDSEQGATKAVFSPVKSLAAPPSLGPPFSLPKGSEILKLLVGNNGQTMYALARIPGNFGFPLSPFGNTIILLKSPDGGVNWVISAHGALSRDTNIVPPGNLCVWDIAIAPDNPRLVYAAISNKSSGGGVGMNQQVWASQDGGLNWENTNWPPAGVTAGVDIISAMDVTSDINNFRKVLVGTRNGIGTANSIAVMKMPGFGGWNIQSTLGTPPSPTWFTGDVIAAKFSPTFASDSTIVTMFTAPIIPGPSATYIICGVHDIAQNTTVWQTMSQVEVKNAASRPGSSPGVTNIINGMLQLPSDFSGQSPSLRRIYASTDAAPAVGYLKAKPTIINNSPNPGAPIINNFIAAPDIVLIAPGQSTTLSWNVVGATVATIDQGIGAVPFPIGAQVVVPPGPLTYTLTATNVFGLSTARIEFVVALVASSSVSNPSAIGAPVINSFIATPSIIYPGEATTLSWNVVGATAATIDQGIGAVPFPIGAQLVAPLVPITYTLTATNASGSTTAAIAFAFTKTPNQGVYRIDDGVISTLMDNTLTWAHAGATPSRRSHSIALFGTYASAKLLVGETLGHSCQAAVPVWFTDSPMSTVSCWYPAKKSPTGAAGIADNCTQRTQYYGNAYVAWSLTSGDKGVAYCVTGSSSFDPRDNPVPPPPYLSVFNMPMAGDWTAAEGLATLGWPSGLLNYRAFDESAFSLSRNNGETWNQLALIDTNIVKLTDVAPSADCKTVYLASANNGTNCKGFDSVWRSSENEAVVSPPLPARPIGQIWERVRTSPTAITCNATQSNYAILRLAPDRTNGQIVFWAAGGGTGLADCVPGGWSHYETTMMADGITPIMSGNTRAAAWSPDFGDYWSDINPRNAVQDMAAESSMVLYVIDTDGNVQKMPYVGTAWSNSIQTVATNLGGGHTIDAQAEGRVLAGNRAGASTPFPAAISINAGASFIPNQRTLSEGINNVGIHALIDTDYKSNGTVFAANDNIVAPMGRVWRNRMPSGANIDWEDMVTGFTPHMGYFGIAETNSRNASGQGTLYAAHIANAPATWSGVERTLLPLSGIPKPGIVWDCMDASASYYQPNNVCFTMEPESLKLCGCLTQETNTTLWAIDNKWYASNHTAYSGQGHGGTAYPVRSTGMLWAYVDCMAKKGPKLTMDDGTIIGCDPATGRAQEVNFTWEQLCIANAYQLVVAKDKATTQVVHDSGVFYLVPPTLMSPTYIYFTSNSATLINMSGTDNCAGAWAAAPQIPLECGHQYFWKVRVRNETTCDSVRSPWSDVRSFTIKAGFRVTTPYYGPQLLAPDNGCGCPCGAPVAFSWSPFKEAQEYKFELSANADMSSPLVSTGVKTTAYQFSGTLKCNTSYFWRVQATRPAPSEWSAVFTFQTQKEALAPLPPVPPPATPFWVWAVIGIGAILVTVILVLILRTRKT